MARHHLAPCASDSLFFLNGNRGYRCCGTLQSLKWMVKIFLSILSYELNKSKSSMGHMYGSTLFSRLHHMHVFSLLTDVPDCMRLAESNFCAVDACDISALHVGVERMPRQSVAVFGGLFLSVCLFISYTVLHERAQRFPRLLFKLQLLILHSSAVLCNAIQP